MECLRKFNHFLNYFDKFIFVSHYVIKGIFLGQVKQEVETFEGLVPDSVRGRWSHVVGVGLRHLNEKFVAVRTTHVEQVA